MYFTLQDKEPFAFAGLWDTWKNPEGEMIRTCTIITTNANELVTPVHDRMPVILPVEARDEWLNSSIHDQPFLLSLLQPFPADAMAVREVSKKVNNAHYDNAELIA